MPLALILQSLPWIVALVALLALLGVLMWRSPQGKSATKALPTDWNLAARPVFSSDERRVYRQLREALPHHIILSKLPLVRFCQPNDPQEVRYWYDLLGAIHVTFAICSANGRVLAAIDLDSERGNSRRVLQIKQSVLGACRIRHLRCPAEHLPSIPELQLLVPHSGTVRGPQPATSRAMPHRTPRDPLANAAPSRRPERTALWQDSSFFQDSFFAPDARDDPFATSEFQSLPGSPFGAPPSAGEPRESLRSRAGDDEGAGVAIDPARSGTRTRH
jgi:hypothetical protein